MSLHNSNLSISNICRLIAFVCFVSLLLLMINACSSNITSSQQSLAEKPVKSIRFLRADQMANGILVKFAVSVNAKSRARSLTTAGLVAKQDFALVPGLIRAETNDDLTINQTLKNLQADPLVAYAEPDYIVNVNATTPDDREFPMQWGLNNNNDVDIDAPEAWDIQQGDGTIVVAVIDSGVDYNHPDLKDQMWINSDEIPNNGLDDDNNGFIDDVNGWDFEANNNDNDPMDENNHGTHVSGIIGARANNGIGIAGVNWRIKIMALKFMNPAGGGATSAAIRALDYAVANGARISNNSWGGGDFSQALFDAIQSANRQGHLFVAAAGNGGTDGVGDNTDNLPHYPSTYNLPNIISVAASDQQDRLSSFSNFGSRTVDLAAPGFQIISTVRNGLYESSSGSSMASPFVAGVAALLLSQNGKLTVAELKAAILDNVDPVPGLSGLLLTGGRLNAFSAITGVSAANPGTPTPLTPVEIMVPATTILAIGDQLQLSVQGGDGSYTWSTLTPLNANVDATGLVTALAEGTALVVASDGTGLLSTALILTINGPTTANLFLSPAIFSALNLNAVTLFSVSGGMKPYTWLSSEPTIGSISVSPGDSSRVSVRAEKSGSFSITATDVNGASITSDQIVVSVPALSIATNKSVLTTGEFIQLGVSGGTSPYIWRSSNPTVASIDLGGLVTAHSAGLTEITVTDVMGIRKSVGLQVVQAPSGELTVTPEKPILNIGSRQKLKATGGGVLLSWTSSDSSVVRIDERGIANALKLGTVQISVTDENGITGVTTIEVRFMDLEADQFTVTGGNILRIFARGGKKPYRWSVSNTTMATIDSGGVLTGNSNGLLGGVLVTVTDANGLQKKIIVTVIR